MESNKERAKRIGFAIFGVFLITIVLISLLSFTRDLSENIVLKVYCIEQTGNPDIYVDQVDLEGKVNCCSSEVIIINNSWVKHIECEALR